MNIPCSRFSRFCWNSCLLRPDTSAGIMLRPTWTLRGSTLYSVRCPRPTLVFISPASVYKPRPVRGRHLHTRLRADSYPRADARLQLVDARLHAGVFLQATPVHIEPVSVYEPLHRRADACPRRAGIRLSAEARPELTVYLERASVAGAHYDRDTARAFISKGMSS